jgi:hypothetical protein
MRASVAIGRARLSDCAQEVEAEERRRDWEKEGRNRSGRRLGSRRDGVAVEDAACALKDGLRALCAVPTPRAVWPWATQRRLRPERWRPLVTIAFAGQPSPAASKTAPANDPDSIQHKEERKAANGRSKEATTSSAGSRRCCLVAIRAASRVGRWWLGRSVTPVQAVASPSIRLHRWPCLEERRRGCRRVKTASRGKRAVGRRRCCGAAGGARRSRLGVFQDHGLVERAAGRPALGCRGVRLSRLAVRSVGAARAEGGTRRRRRWEGRPARRLARRTTSGAPRPHLMSRAYGPGARATLATCEKMGIMRDWAAWAEERASRGEYVHGRSRTRSGGASRGTSEPVGGGQGKRSGVGIRSRDGREAASEGGRETALR